jgi:FtsZ-binding cell division protein ZapB
MSFVQEAASERRADAVELAGALQIKVDQIYERNDSLEAENHSLRTAHSAVSVENENLRKYIEKIVRQRDAAMRKVDLYESKMKIIFAESESCLLAAQPAKTDPAPASAPRGAPQPIDYAQPHRRLAAASGDR